MKEPLSRQPDHFERLLNEIEDVSQMLDEKGERDGKSRYMEIMAKLLLSIDDSLCALRGFAAIGIGLAVGLALSRLIDLLLAG